VERFLAQHLVQHLVEELQLVLEEVQTAAVLLEAASALQLGDLVDPLPLLLALLVAQTVVGLLVVNHLHLALVVNREEPLNQARLEGVDQMEELLVAVLVAANSWLYVIG
jgi:hypothetical protein